MAVMVQAYMGSKICLRTSFVLSPMKDITEQTLFIATYVTFEDHVVMFEEPVVFRL